MQQQAFPLVDEPVDEKQLIADFLAEASSWSDFYKSLHAQLQRKGELSEKQWQCAIRGMQKVQAKPVTTDASGIVQAMQRAVQNGLKRPILRTAGLTISLAPDTGNNAGYYYIKIAGEYAGKVSPEGQFTIRYNIGEEVRTATMDQIKAIAADPLAAAVRFGRETGCCACCGRELTDPESVERGVGPICAERWFH